MSLVNDQEPDLNFKAAFFHRNNDAPLFYKLFNVFNKKSPSIRLQLAVKRLFDVVFSIMSILILTPVLLLIAILIRIDSPGPALFTQTRWGQNQKKIKVLKFRTMYHHLGDESGIQQTTTSDERITRFGAFLRKTNLDELPQFFNILIGDMSVIGPRCHAIGMLAAGVLYEDLVPDYHIRHHLKPGLTGLAQARGLRGPTDRPSKARARIACDLYYVSNFSLMLDIKIFFSTIKHEVFGGSGF